MAQYYKLLQRGLVMPCFFHMVLSIDDRFTYSILLSYPAKQCDPNPPPCIMIGLFSLPFIRATQNPAPFLKSKNAASGLYMAEWEYDTKVVTSKTRLVVWLTFNCYLFLGIFVFPLTQFITFFYSAFHVWAGCLRQCFVQLQIWILLWSQYILPAVPKMAGPQENWLNWSCISRGGEKQRCRS